MSDEKELGLETLLTVRTELGVDFDTDFLNACFKIQKKYQFNHDNTLSINAMDKLIENYVEKVSESLKKDKD